MERKVRPLRHLVSQQLANDSNINVVLVFVEVHDRTVTDRMPSAVGIVSARGD